jgi:hypothetical protein
MSFVTTQPWPQNCGVEQLARIMLESLRKARAP